MPAAEDIYRATLEELAKEGNEKAKFALELAKKFATQPVERADIIGSLQSAHDSLLRALEENNSEWTSQTDREIREAMSHIIDVIGSV